MEYTKLHGADLTVSRIGMGCEQLGGTDWGSIDIDEVSRAVDKALDLGVNLFDTADVYGLGKSEENLSRALGEKRHDVVIVTKGGVAWEQPNAGRARTYRDLTPGRLMQSIEASLRRLRVEAIPIYLIHFPDEKTPFDEVADLLERCVAQGKIRYFGVSNFLPDHLAKALGRTGVSLAQYQYSLLDRSIETGIMQMLSNHNISLMVFGALAQGLLSGKYTADSTFDRSDRRSRLAQFAPEAWEKVSELLGVVDTTAKAHNAIMSQIAVNWVLTQKGVASAIVGVRSTAQIETVAAALELQLSPQEAAALTACRTGSFERYQERPI